MRLKESRLKFLSSYELVAKRPEKGNGKNEIVLFSHRQTGLQRAPQETKQTTVNA
jgi:hypothetical protein